MLYKKTLGGLADGGRRRVAEVSKGSSLDGSLKTPSIRGTVRIALMGLAVLGCMAGGVEREILVVMDLRREGSQRALRL